jgi:hypothetical protein
MKNHHLKAGLVAFLALGSFVPEMFGEPVTYDFNGLKPGPLSANTDPTDEGNQDGWYLDSAIPESVMYIDTAETDANTTNQEVCGPGKNVQARAYRNFGSPFYTGEETGAVLQFDCQVGGGYAGTALALGGNGTATLIMHGNAMGAFGPMVTAFMNPAGTVFTLAITPKAAQGTPGTPSTQEMSIDIGDTLQIRMVMDFTANGGNGSGSLFYKNLTAGDTSFTASTVSNVNLGLTSNPAAYRASKWNQVYTQVTATGGPHPAAIDNLVIKTQP